MPKSMTGYGRADAMAEGRTFQVECRSVNHRYLELSIRLPYAFNAYESIVRAKAQEYLSRGRVEIRVTEEGGGTPRTQIVIDRVLAQSYLDALYELELMAGTQVADRVGWLSRCEGVLSAGQEDEDDEVVAGLIVKAVEGALQKLNHAREEEGAFIANDLLDKVDEFRNLTIIVEERSSEIPSVYREKLLARAEELLEEKRPEWYDDQRLFAETALYADRASIDEEVTRLAAHVTALEEGLRSPEPVGRRLDFLIQEILREVNTIGSKAGDLILTQTVVEMKTLIEKIREQVQNLE
ncbi:MAG TPA: YicC family protein [Clostridiaceae bacterium]|nr:YicC family protein [Clostridiaceae bacterium]